jgi:hypothetical protein
MTLALSGLAILAVGLLAWVVIQKNRRQTMADLAPLTAAIASNTTVIGSALTLINGFAAQLAAAGTDPTKLADLAASLKTSDDALAAAVAANTPAASQPSGPASPVPAAKHA